MTPTNFGRSGAAEVFVFGVHGVANQQISTTRKCDEVLVGFALLGVGGVDDGAILIVEPIGETPAGVLCLNGCDAHSIGLKSIASLEGAVFNLCPKGHVGSNRKKGLLHLIQNDVFHVSAVARWTVNCDLILRIKYGPKKRQTLNMIVMVVRHENIRSGWSLERCSEISNSRSEIENDELFAGNHRNAWCVASVPGRIGPWCCN